MIVWVDLLEVELPPKVLDDRLKAWGNFWCAILIAAGVAIEVIAGFKADTKSDEIRIALQQRILRVSPRVWLLTSDAQDRICKALRPYGSQKVEIFANQKAVDDKSEVLSFAVALDSVLNHCGWRGPLLPILNKGLFSNIRLDPPNGESATGVSIEPAREAPPSVENAADALSSALGSEQLSTMFFSPASPTLPLRRPM